MTRRRPCPNTAELFNWSPPEPVAAFEERRIKAASLANEMARVISETLQASDDPREVVAANMSKFLGQSISPAMLDKYASEAAEDHVINIVRFIALLQATGDRRPLQHIAQMFGWMVIEEKYLPAIRYAQKAEFKVELEKELDAERRLMRKGGII